MNQLKTLIVLSLLCMTSLGAKAQAQLVLDDGSGTPQTVYLADIGRMWFDDGQLKVSILSTSQTHSLALSGVKKLSFKNVSTDIRQHVSDALPAGPEGYAVFDLQGRRVMTADSRQALQALPRGVYIVNGKKVVIK